MRTLPKRVENAYFQLKKSRIILKNEFDDEAIDHFEKLLNSSLPVTEYEYNIYYLIKDMYYNDKNKFINYINNSNLDSLILYTDNKRIINHFKLIYKLYINWNKDEKKYIVEKYDRLNNTKKIIEDYEEINNDNNDNNDNNENNDNNDNNENAENNEKSENN
jgi:hypothetical protein